MRADSLHRLRAAAALAVMALLGLLTFGPASAAQASGFVPLVAAGSTYAYPALNQWATDLESEGIAINYDPTGSAAGRQAYLSNQLDFAGSDIAFLTAGDADPFAGVDAQQLNFAYSYIPDVAGGLSFLYNLQVAGHKITNMRLSGETLAKIFTGQITNWDNPAITHDYGQQLPNIPITVVTRSDGAGESYFLSNWLLDDYPEYWVPFCKAAGGGKLCNTTPTEYYPHNLAWFKALDLATGVSSYISSPDNNGAIGYAEYYYAKAGGIPAVSMENKAGYDVQPTASNVAIALEKAVINEHQNSVDFLMQTLNSVYTDPDPRAYPLSSYSYLIVPRTSRTIGGHTYHPLSSFNNNKGKALSTYVNYVLCQAQQTAGQLGYSPLPEPMVTGGFLQDKYIPGAVPNPSASNYNGCNNPAYHDGVDVLTATAPYPNACQEATAPLNCTVVDGRATPAGPGGTNSNGTNGTNGNGTNGKNSNGTNGNGTNSTNSTNGNGSINPNTGQVDGPGGTSSANSDAYAQPVGFASRPAEQWLFGVLTALVLIAAITVPVLLGPLLQHAGRRPPGPGGPGHSGPSGGER
jgi:ABC-type phosphate transport system substrate-binding protein